MGQVGKWMGKGGCPGPTRGQHASYSSCNRNCKNCGNWLKHLV